MSICSMGNFDYVKYSKLRGYNTRHLRRQLYGYGTGKLGENFGLIPLLDWGLVETVSIKNFDRELDLSPNTSFWYRTYYTEDMRLMVDEYECIAITIDLNDRR